MAEIAGTQPTGSGTEAGCPAAGCPQGRYPVEGKPFFPHHFVDRIILVLMVVAIMISLATFYPAAVEEQADPLLMPEALRPAWYFLPIFQVLRLADRLGREPRSGGVPGLLGVYGVATGFLIILTWPWIARVHRGPAGVVLRLVEVAGILLLVGLTLWGWLS